MAITADKVNLEKFLEIFTPTTGAEAGKVQLSDADFLNIAALLKIDFTLQRILRRLK